MSGIDGRHRIRHDREERRDFYSKNCTIHLFEAITTGHSASYLVVAWSTMQDNRPSK
jgi:hypothetical protein